MGTIANRKCKAATNVRKLENRQCQTAAKVGTLEHRKCKTAATMGTSANRECKAAPTWEDLKFENQSWCVFIAWVSGRILFEFRNPLPCSIKQWSSQHLHNMCIDKV
jgi:hypothetical protein